MNIHDAMLRAARDFEAQGQATPRLDAEVIIAHVLKTDRLYLFRHPERLLTEAEAVIFQALVDRRRQSEPVAYLLGVKEFWSRTFDVDARVLIPRPETEILVEEVLKVCSGSAGQFRAILELGTGSGAVAVALAGELPHVRITATDLSPEAIALARRNAGRYGFDQRIHFLVGDLFAPLSGKFDMIVSNPPYISDVDIAMLPAGVKDYEPVMALAAGSEGMAFHERIIAGCEVFLKPGGRLFLEIGALQKNGVEARLQRAGFFDEIRFRRDYAGLDRVAIAKKKA